MSPSPATVIYVIICGKQEDGTVTPLKCNADGELIIKEEGV
jgi:hypothetical protein